MQLKIKKKHAGVPTPFYATAGAACFDLYADTKKDFNEAFGYVEYGTGLSFEIPQGYAGLIFPRSSISNTHQDLANCVGIIDSDYRGEVTLRFRNSTFISERLLKLTGAFIDRLTDGGRLESSYIQERLKELVPAATYQAGERIGQMMILPITQVNEFVVVDKLSDTERGTGGYGSTGTAGIPIIEG